jgi:hypothetical protein
MLSITVSLWDCSSNFICYEYPPDMMANVNIAKSWSNKHTVKH